MKFIHLTDTHLLAPGQQLHGIDPRARLLECLDHVAANHGDAAFCVLTGDLADRGEAEAYTLLHKALGSFPLKVHLLLGNHDHRQKFLAAFPNKQCDSNGFVQGVVHHEVGDFIFLDTLDQGGHKGLLCEKRLRWMADCLDTAAGRPVFLFMHHPPFPIGIPPLDAIALAIPDEFSAVLQGRGNIRHLFFGHVHRPVSGSWKGIPFSSLSSFVHQVALKFEADSVISYSKEPPAYGVVEIDDDRIVVNTCYYQDNSAWRPQRRPSLDIK